MGAWVGPAIVAAIISSLVTVASWYVGHERERRLERRRRAERVRDVQTALLADIRSYRSRSSIPDIEATGKAAVEAIASAMDGESFTPFVPQESGSLLWKAIVDQIQVLPTATIEPVVSFYSQLDLIGSFADDLRTDRFASLSKARKANMYADYIRLRIRCATLALDAEAALRDALGLPPLSNSEPDPWNRRSAWAPEAEEGDGG